MILPRCYESYQGKHTDTTGYEIATLSCLEQSEYQLESGYDLEKTVGIILNGVPIYKNGQSGVDAWWGTCITDMMVDEYSAPVDLERSFAAWLLNSLTKKSRGISLVRLESFRLSELTSKLGEALQGIEVELEKLCLA